MLKKSIRLTALATLFFSSFTQAKEMAWSPLFDGKTLDGWIQKNGKATYRAEDGMIIGKTAKDSPNSFLCTKKSYRNFELEFEVKHLGQGFNSGVQIRSQTKPAKGNAEFGRVNGPQVEIEPSMKDGGESGYIYDEAIGTGWLTPKDKLKTHKIFKDDDWNHYRIVANGPRIQTWLNGELVSDLANPDVFKSYPEGFIGLQIHHVGNRGPFQMAWRKIQIKELNE